MRLPQKGSATSNLLRVAVWVAMSAVVTWFVSTVSQRPELFNPIIVGVVNSFGVFIVDFINKNKPNY